MHEPTDDDVLWLGLQPISVVVDEHGFDALQYAELLLRACSALDADVRWQQWWSAAPRPLLVLRPWFEDEQHRAELAAMPVSERRTWAVPAARLSRSADEVRVHGTFDVEPLRNSTPDSLDAACREVVIELLEHARRGLGLPVLPPLPWRS